MKIAEYQKKNPTGYQKLLKVLRRNSARNKAQHYSHLRYKTPPLRKREFEEKLYVTLKNLTNEK
jgi:hypothetical protein